MTKINTHVLMSGADYFDDAAAINPYMDKTAEIDRAKAQEEHELIRQALQDAGVHITQVAPPEGCQDGVYTANWGLERGGKVILSALPKVRQAETPYAKEILESLGKTVITPPVGLRFSGQGDALPCGNLLFCGSTYRTDPEIYRFIEETLGFEVTGLKTVPKLDDKGNPATNPDSGWPDSYFYDIDLALAVIRPDLIAYCPDAFTPESQKILADLNIEKIEVSLEEAKKGYACNLVSTGETVVMSDEAPELQKALEERGLKTITPHVRELRKGGGYIRCTSLTLDN